MNFLAIRYKRYHISYLLGWTAFGVLAGLGLTQIGTLSLHGIWLVSLMLLILTMFHQRRWWSIGIVVVCGLLIGWSRGSDFMSALLPYAAYQEQQVTLRGVIADDPQSGTKGDIQLRLKAVEIKGDGLPGEVFVSTRADMTFRRGDFVTATGKLDEKFGSFQATMYSAVITGVTVSDDPVRELRDRFVDGVRSSVPEPAASLGVGFVVGQRSALPPDLDDDLRAVGLTHIVVASGYNLTILVRLSRRLLQNHSKYLATVISGGLMTGFVLVSGLSPSMTRAALVTGLSLAAWYYGRRFHPLLLIIYAAAYTAYINPVYLWADIGWYLSFLAFAGVLIVAPMLQKLIFRKREVNSLWQIVIETTSAQLLTLPLILMMFGQLPLLSVLANALIAPIIPLAMLLTAMSGAAAIWLPLTAPLAGAVTGTVIGYILAVVEWLSTPSWSQLDLPITAYAMAGLYLLLIAGAIVLWRRLSYNFRSTSVVE